MNKVPMTAEGKERLQEELYRLKNVERPKLSRAISEARAHGDLRENAEYHAAREMQSFTEGRIQEIDGKLGQSFVVDLSKIENNGKVVFGAVTKLYNNEEDNEVEYQIVGEDEADLKEAKISFNSPIARSVIGKNVGDSVEVSTPKGVVEYTIMAVDYR